MAAKGQVWKRYSQSTRNLVSGEVSHGGSSVTDRQDSAAGQESPEGVICHEWLKFPDILSETVINCKEMETFQIL